MTRHPAPRTRISLWWLAVPALVAAAVGAHLLYHSEDGPGLDDDKIRNILETELARAANVPARACLPLLGVPPLPASASTEVLAAQKPVVDALVKNKLITLSPKGEGRAPGLQPGYEIDGQLTQVALTAEGKRVYQASPHTSANTLDTALFCPPGLVVGEILHSTDPLKNPNGGNDNLIALVKFQWKLPQPAQGWAADPALAKSVLAWRTAPESEDGWHSAYITLERRGSTWGLGDRPYVVRW
ncbi:hypothetical protein CEG14_11135 [Bordetella genomosp. 1]|uniref:Uncharacterized protein n=1 Tax=Bordetella genomosp. 1 TaxID=1395607 RepID=A0A261SEP7_9BORD|nr:hypothetical protein [Bordetella genomosp. 1]MDQ8032049.1 hypothetical protein [Bordetella sp.]OZI35615.1 hypothetical protein CEG14_11135 [Bordetella genomosp. 1]